MDIIGIIPARYQSSRFPGKPLADICGKPMIWWVYQHCKEVEEFTDVYVATDDMKIFDICQRFMMKAVLTSPDNLTGTDRVAEVAQKMPADLYVNIQGDEPLLEPETIRAAIQPFFDHSDVKVTNLMAKIANPIDIVNATVPKVIVNKDNMGIYLTRACAPYPKGRLDFHYHKQVCVYGFRPDALQFFYDYGKKYGKARIEAIEDIEVLRFIENGYCVKYIEVFSDTISVDTFNDLEKVRRILAEKSRGNEVNDTALRLHA